MSDKGAITSLAKRIKGRLKPDRKPPSNPGVEEKIERALAQQERVKEVSASAVSEVEDAAKQ